MASQAHECALIKAEKPAEKEKRTLRFGSRIAYVELLNAELRQKISELETILEKTLSVGHYLDLESLKKKPKLTAFSPGKLGVETPGKPNPDQYLPLPPKGIKKILPGTAKAYKRKLENAQKLYKKHLNDYNRKENERQRKLRELEVDHHKMMSTIREQAESHNQQIEQFKQAYMNASPEAVVEYCALVLTASSYPDGFPQKAEMAYIPESKQLVIEYDLPKIDVIPEVAAYNYIKTKDEITEKKRSETQRKSLYLSVISQITLRTIHEIFNSDRRNHIAIIVFNGYVDSIDRGTGQNVRPCLITVRTTRDVFNQINLSQVEPIACLKTLNAQVSKSPTELTPVRPVVEFSKVDPRFIEETDVISSLDQRPNLMELSPSEFEALISNLFQKMGLETRLTRASRDGGVDCVAYDPRPILGGKVIIQAKRYKNTVGVSAVRDLFGTLQNEGASKGILVTTSGYGRAAFEFAEGKPIELLSGSNLIHLLAEHAGIEAKIEIPENWKEYNPDSPGEE